MNIISDLAMKVGGVLALVGFGLGAWLNSSTTCSSSFIAEKSCRNFRGEVSLGVFGEPDVTALFSTGGAVGAVIGALLGLGIVTVWPQTKNDLF